MKKVYLLLVLVLMSICAWAQYNAPCDFHIRTEVTQATCYNNGKVLVVPVDGEGNELTILPDSLFDELNPGNGLSGIKYCYKNLYSPTDTAEQCQYDPLLVLDTGTYIIHAEVLCFDPTQSGDDRYTLLSDTDTVVITTSYVKPKVSVIEQDAQTVTGYGTVPTLWCENTGRVQLRIYDGAFPYMIRVCNADTVPIDTIYFDGNQYTGTNQNRYDYLEYYSIDSLAAGKYFFFVEDGCDYHLPRVWQQVREVQEPKITAVSWYAWSGSYADSNVIRVQMTVNMPNAYYTNPEYVQYRFIHEDINGITDTTDWQYVPNMQNLVTGNNYVTVRDTLHNAGGYCDIYGKKVTFQARMTACRDTINLTKWHQWDKPTEFQTGRVWVPDYTWPYAAVYDSCGYYGGYDTSYGHWEPVIWFYNYNEYHYRSSDATTSTTGNKYQVTYPIYWVYTDADGDTLKIDTVRNITQPGNVGATDSWTSYSSPHSTHPASRLRAEDIYPKYGDFLDTTLVIPITRTMYNAQGCPIYTRTDNITFKKEWKYTTAERYNQYWSADYSYTSYDYCCEYERYVRVYGNYLNNIYMDSTIVELYESPLGNKYNYRAVYHLDTHSWTYEKDSISNLARIVPSGYSSIYLYDYCLPSGLYKFRIITKCDTFYASTHPGFPDTYSWFYDEPEFNLRYECTNLIIKPKYKYFYHRTYNNDKNYYHNGSTYWDVYDSVERVNPRFRIIKNLTGSTTTFNTNYRYLGDSLRVTGAGTYVIEITPSVTSNSYCTPPVLYDTITFDGGTVAFKYAYSWVCDEQADTGFVRVKAFEGTAPYNYTLYSGSGKTGEILGQNQTGVFDRVPVHAGQVVSCYIEDQCLASYWIDIPVWDMEHVKKAWFLDGLQVTEACEGSDVNLYAIGLDESVVYHWTGPDGFEQYTQDTHVFLPRGADTGYYKVEILNTGCRNTVASDSVQVNVWPAPRVTILRDTTVCPGEEVQVWYLTEGEGDVHYTIAYEENSAITETQHTNDDSLTFIAMAQRTFWVKEVEDDRCHYTIPEDTVVINITSHVASACDVITESDPICRAEDGVTYASSVLPVPYYLKWYRDYEQTELLRIDTIDDASFRSPFNFTGLTQDTSVYVTAYNADYCENRYGMVVNWLDMSQGTSVLRCAQSIRFYDDGGLNANYSPNMDAKRVFITEDGQPITITFEMLNLQSTYDHIYIFNGNTTNTDSMIAHYSGNYTGNLPAPIVSSHDTMTVWFLSNGKTEAAGWVATVSNNPRPAAASVHVFDTMYSTIADASVHIRFDGSAEVTATAAGGRGELYQYVWQTSIDDGATWTSVDTQLLASDTSLLVLEHNTQPTLVRVLVTDASIEACEGVGTAQVALPVAHIKLALEVSVPDVPHCSQDYPVTVTVRNYGQGTADSVWAKVKLPANVDFVNQADSMLFLGDMPGGMVIDTVINVRSYIIQNVPSAHPVKAQIWYCVEADSVPSVTYGDWDWNRTDLQLDEDVDTMHVMPFFTMDDYSIVGFDDTVCFLGTAYLHASSDLVGTQYIKWFGDQALRNLLKIDTLQNGQLSEYALDSLRTVTTLYVTIESEDFCPAVLAGAVNGKFNSIATHTEVIKNGSTLIGVSDKVRLYDTGGNVGSYGNNEDFTHTFSTGSGEVALRLNSINIGNAGDVLTIYDGPTASGIPLTQITSSVSSAMIYTSTTGALTLRWHSDGSSVGSGWNADVVNTVNYASSQATAYLYEPLAVTEVTANDDYVCYGDSATVTASTGIAAPQYFTWYDADFNMLKQDTSNNGTSNLTVYNQTRQNTYYVAVGNEANCPATVPENNFLNSSVVLMTSSINGRTTKVEPEKRVNFYDEGGPGGDYWTTSASWYHTFLADSGNITLTFSQFYTESTNYDWIELFDGPSSSSPRIYVNGNYKLGGDLSNQMPLTITSSGNSLTVFWRTDGSVSKSGWRATVSNGNAGGSSSIVKDYDIMLDATTNEQVTIVSPEDIFGFFDDGGPNGAYSNAAGNFTHTFTATQGVVQADLSSLYLQSNDHLYVYDGPEANDDYLIADLTGNISRRQFFSTGHSMTFKLFTHGNTDAAYTGWSMNISSNWKEALAEANVNLYSPIQDVTITATNADVCFNSSAELTASSDNGVYFTWFKSDGRTVVQLDTALDHVSLYDIDHVRHDDYFYIVTTPEGSCPTIIPYQYSDKYLNIGTNGKTTVVGNDDFIRFYDDGGSSANYRSERLDYTHTFKAETGEIYVKMNNHYLQNKDTLWIYDGSSVNPDSILVEWNLATQNSGNAQSFVSKHGSVTFRFRNNSGSNSNGWSAFITTSPIEAQTVLLNPLTSNKTTFLSPIDSVLFYDDGGASGNYTPLERTLRHTFTALQGKVRMKFDNSNNLCNNDHFYVYDGPVGTGTLLGDFTSSQLNNRVFVSTGNQLGVQVSTINNSNVCSGWNATVTTVYDLPQARADVTIHSPAEKTNLITTGDYVCYGDTAQVTARSPKLVYPQYYTWYDASMNELMRDTLYEYGSSRYTIPNLTYDTCYYVATQYATECPAVLPLNKAEIRAYAGNGSQTTIVNANDYLHFFDSGGQSGNYSGDPGDYVHTFTSANNKSLYLIFSTPNHYFQTNDTLYLYDGPVVDNAHLLERYTAGYGNNGPFISESNSFTFKFAKHGTSYANGWHAIISEGEQIRTSTVLLNQASNNKTTILLPSDSILFYDEGGASNNYTNTRETLVHTFKAMQGEVLLKFTSMNTQSRDTIYVYRGSSVDPANLIAKYRPTSFTNNSAPVFQDTALTVRFWKNSGSSNSGWVASVINVLNPIVDTACVGIYRPLAGVNVTATDDTVCYDGTASLFACSEIGFPQYYTWYDKNMSEVLLVDTVNSGCSEFAPTHQISDTLYHIVIYNDTTCPYLPEVYYLPDREATADFIFNSSKNRLTTLVSDADSIPFYDEGGPLGDYANSSDYTHTFEAENNHIQLILNTFQSYNNSDNLYIYDGYTTSAPLLYQAYGDLSSSMPKVITSTGKALTVRWVTNNSSVSSGWSGSIMTNSKNAVATATSHVIIHKPLPDVYVTSTDDTVCYDGTASLFACSEIAYPQYYTWYDKNMTEVLLVDTVNSGCSEFDPPHQISDSLYHIVVYNDTTCPYLPDIYFFAERDVKDTFLLNSSKNGGTTLVRALDSIPFFDEGGPTGNYTNNHNYIHTFETENDNIVLELTEFQTYNNLDVLYIYDGYNISAPLLFSAYGNLTAAMPKTFTSTGKALTVRWYTDGSNVSSGWNGSIKTNTELGVAVSTSHVTIKGPLSGVYVTATHDTVCYDGTAALTATSEIAYPQYYTWYKNDTATVLHTDTVHNASEATLFTPEHQIQDSLYYVTIYNDTTCPFIPELHITICPKELTDNFIYNASKNNGTTHVANVDSIPFYDDGGPGSDYAVHRANWTHTFTTDTGHVVLKLTSFMSEPCCDYMRVYDGPTASGTNTLLQGELTTITASNPRVIISTGNSLTVYWYTDGSAVRSGWDGYIYNTATSKCVDLASATVHIKDANGGQYVTAVNDTVCYDGTAALTATSDLGYPQYYTWYQNDSVTALYQDTVASASDATWFNPEHQIKDSLYYVAIYNDTTCPYIPEVHLHCNKTVADEFLFNSSKSSRTTILTAQDSIPFYDEGGPDGSYSTSINYWYHTFTADSGHVVLKLNSFNTANSNDYLAVYDGTSASGTLLGGNSLYGNLSSSMPKTLISSGKSLTVKWYRNSGYSGYPGWKGYVYTDVAPTCIELAPATVHIKDANGGRYVTAIHDTVCYDGTAALTATSDLSYPQYYTWYDIEKTTVLHTDTVLSASESPWFRPDHQITDSLYYVSIYNDTTCPYIPGLHDHCEKTVLDTFLFNSAKNNKTTLVNASQSIAFFDEGGQTGNYYYKGTWNHTFTADSGNIILEISSLSTYNSNDYLVVYDGTSTSGTVLSGGNLYGTLTSAQLPITMRSSGKSLTVRWVKYYNNGSYTAAGWKGTVTTSEKPCTSLAPATVHIKDANGGQYVTATNDEVCYDETAALTASSGISYPQYYTWYMSDSVTVLQRDTLTSASDATWFNPTHQIQDSLYYVTIYNDTTCPYLPDVHLRCTKTLTPDFLFNYYVSSKTTNLDANDSIPFYDDGGKYDNYTNGASRVHTFTADSGHVVLTLTSFKTFNSNDYLDIYNGTSTSSTRLAHLYGDHTSEMPMTYTSTGKSLFVRWVTDGSNLNMGWEGAVYTDVAPTCIELAPAIVKVNPTYEFAPEYEVICANDTNTFVWRGKKFQTSGIYYDSLKTQAGCDSVYTLSLTVNPTYLFEEDTLFCESQTFTWENHPSKVIPTEVGSYVIWDSLKTTFDCDSVYKLTLVINPPDYFEEDTVTCETTPYVWVGHEYVTIPTTAGTHIVWDSLTNRFGCDSVYKLTLVVKPIPEMENVDNLVVCTGTDTAVTFISLTTTEAVSFRWESDNPSVGIAANGTTTGRIEFTAVNAGTTPEVANISVIPVFTAGGVECEGDEVYFTVTVNPEATMNPLTDQTVCNFTTTQQIVFSTVNRPAGNTTYEWTNDNTGIGLGASGTGRRIAAFLAQNAGNMPEFAHIAVVPTYTYGGVSCEGDTQHVTITVLPTPVMQTLSNQTLCTEANTQAITFGEASTITTYTWTNDNPSIGLAATGTGLGINSFQVTNTTHAPAVATIEVTPTCTYNGVVCEGISQTFTITVNPTASMNPLTDRDVCHNNTLNSVSFITDDQPTGSTSFAWTNSNAAIGLAATGSTDYIPAFTAENYGDTNAIAHIQVTPTFTYNEVSCEGTPEEMTITVYPVHNEVVYDTICASELPYTWALNGVQYASEGQYTYQHKDANDCDQVDTLKLTVNPNPVVQLANWDGICPSVGTLNITAEVTSSPVLDYTYVWSGDLVPTSTIKAADQLSDTAVLNIPADYCNSIYKDTVWVTDGNGCSTVAYTEITVVDTVAPTFMRPGDITFYKDADCLAATDTAAAGAPTLVHDNCTAEPTVTYTDSDTTITCEGSYSFKRTWHVVDDCGNVSLSDSVQTITVRDTVRPTYTRPADTTFYKDADCLAATDTTAAGSPTLVHDNCTVEPTVTYTDSDTTITCEGSYSFKRTWHVVDDCGNVSLSDSVQTITVRDTIRPTYTRPADTTFYKDADCLAATDTFFMQIVNILKNDIILI